MILENKEKSCNRMKGGSRCIQKMNKNKCPATGETPEEKANNCVAGKICRYKKG